MDFNNLSKKDIVIIVVILICVIFFIGYYSSTPTESTESTREIQRINPIYDKSLNQTQLETAKKSYAVFCDVCKPLMNEYTDDIEWVKIEKRIVRVKGYGCMDYRCRDYGWDIEYEIQVKIKENPSIIPGELRALGHTIHYYLGGPKNPGINIDKIPELCGKERVSGKDVYISESRLSFINN